MRLKKFVNVLSGGIYNIVSNDGITFVGYVAILENSIFSKYRSGVKHDEIINARVVLFDVNNKEIFIDYRVRKED